VLLLALRNVGELYQDIGRYIPEANEPGQSSRCSDWLRAGRPRGQSLSPGGGKNFLFFTSSRPALGHNYLPIQWVPVAVSPGVKQPGREAEHTSS
jgi:hypothetical protein